MGQAALPTPKGWQGCGETEEAPRLLKGGLACGDVAEETAMKENAEALEAEVGAAGAEVKESKSTVVANSWRGICVRFGLLLLVADVKGSKIEAPRRS